jgi:bifunctional ADP-heptose synthase (sugar kinase/adenylyltransferase)
VLTWTGLHTGAGDQFAAGFLFGLMRGYGLRKCAQLGCLAGGAVVQVLGAEMTQAAWRWLFARCGFFRVQAL